MRQFGRTDDSRASDWVRHSTFRFYEELNDFLPEEKRKVDFDYAYNGTPSVKDAIEAIGVPHPEVDLILVNGRSVGFEHLLRGGERVAVYPVFERLDIAPLIRLRPEPLRVPRFILDVHLGRLARYLRMLGFDALYDAGYSDATIATIGAKDGRTILTRDKGLLKRNQVTRGYWLRHHDPRAQIAEVVAAFQLGSLVKVFTRCMVCNHELETVVESTVRDQLPAGLRGRFGRLSRCPGCRRLYWPGSHYERLAELVSQLVAD